MADVIGPYGLPGALGNITPPTRGAEYIEHRLTNQRPLSNQEDSSNQESRDNHLENQHVGDLRQHNNHSASVMTGYRSSEAVSVNNNPAFHQASQGPFAFGGAPNTFTGLNTHMANMPSGASTQSSSMEFGYSRSMNASEPPSSSNNSSNPRMADLFSTTRNRMGRDDGNSANFASQSQFSSFSSGSGQYDDMPTTSMSYPASYTTSMPNSAQYITSTPYSTQNTTSMPHIGSPQYTTGMSYTQNYSTSMPHIPQYSTSMSDATQYTTNSLPVYNTQYPGNASPSFPSMPPLYDHQSLTSSSSQNTHKMLAHEPSAMWQYGAASGMVSHG